MITRRNRFVFFLIGAVVMLVFNVRYCNEVQTAERSRFEGWVGSLGPRALPENVEIEYRAPDGVTVVSTKASTGVAERDEQIKAQALRLLQVLKEAAVMGRMGASHAERSITVRVGSGTEYLGGFSEMEARQSPQLQVFGRLIEEFKPSGPQSVASGPDSR